MAGSTQRIASGLKNRQLMMVEAIVSACNVGCTISRLVGLLSSDAGASGLR